MYSGNFWIFVIIVIINAVFVAIAAFFGAYFKQKGQNLAQKEDIAKITALMEEIKLNNLQRDRIENKKI